MSTTGYYTYKALKVLPSLAFSAKTIYLKLTNTHKLSKQYRINKTNVAIINIKYVFKTSITIYHNNYLSKNYNKSI